MAFYFIPSITFEIVIIRCTNCNNWILWICITDFFRNSNCFIAVGIKDLLPKFTLCHDGRTAFYRKSNLRKVMFYSLQWHVQKWILMPAADALSLKYISDIKSGRIVLHKLFLMFIRSCSSIVTMTGPHIR